MFSEYGSNVRVRISGESHGEYIRAEIFGVPANEKIDAEALQKFTDKRKSAFSFSTGRRESDVVKVLCGVTDGYTDGEPIRIEIKNEKYDGSEYIDGIIRPSHCDYASFMKFGRIEKGGGHLSGRTTVGLCAAGGIIMQILNRRGIRITSHIAKIGAVSDEPFNALELSDELADKLENSAFKVIDEAVSAKLTAEITQAQERGDSVGGIIETCISGLCAGIGEPNFRGLENEISKCVFSVPAVKGIEFGKGFACAEAYGSRYNDAFYVKNGKVHTESNNDGGINGGISNGNPVIFRAAVKPTPTIRKPQKTVDLRSMRNVIYENMGRHDACIVPRAAAAVESACAIAVYDLIREDEIRKTESLADCRSAIDCLDGQLARTLAKRLVISKIIGRIKREKGITLTDSERENEILSKIKAEIPEYGDKAERIFREIFKASKDEMK